MNQIKFRYAEEKDAAKILYFIKELAAYEKMSDEVIATEELLKEWIFDLKKAEVIFAIVDDKEIGFALFFHNFSTFLGRAGIYLEDLYVMPEYRGKGIGKKCAKLLLNWAKENGAIYAELNYGSNDRRLRFWKSVGFIENGVDEWGEPLMILPDIR